VQIMDGFTLYGLCVSPWHILLSDDGQAYLVSSYHCTKLARTDYVQAGGGLLLEATVLL